MNVLLTGANGFLGKFIAKELSKDNVIFGLSRSSDYYQFSLESEIPKFNQYFDFVIHAAGKAHNTPNSRAEVQSFYEVNVTGTMNLLQGIEQVGLPKKIVFISSVSVYGELNAEMVKEESELKATDPYGKSKIEAEKLILNWCREKGVLCTILRLPLLVGPNPPGNLGHMIKAINKGFYFNVAGGGAKKSMVLATDVARFVMKASKVGGVYNLTDGYHPSFWELSNSISGQLGKSNPKNLPLSIARVMANVGDLIGKKAPINSVKLNKITSSLTFDDTKARLAFGWDPIQVLKALKLSNINL
ncbi:MAG: hypothetical protein RL070_1125 [Bacteroidota bacterium]|jgi:nucleoside-diphosphate-sugar epimerase